MAAATATATNDRKPKLLGSNLQLYTSERQIRRPLPHRRARGPWGRGVAGDGAGKRVAALLTLSGERKGKERQKKLRGI
jgi:hypothetical protein